MTNIVEKKKKHEQRCTPVFMKGSRWSLLYNTNLSLLHIYTWYLTNEIKNPWNVFIKFQNYDNRVKGWVDSPIHFGNFSKKLLCFYSDLLMLPFGSSIIMIWGWICRPYKLIWAIIFGRVPQVYWNNRLSPLDYCIEANSIMMPQWGYNNKIAFIIAEHWGFLN